MTMALSFCECDCPLAVSGRVDFANCHGVCGYVSSQGACAGKAKGGAGGWRKGCDQPSGSGNVMKTGGSTVSFVK